MISLETFLPHNYLNLFIKYLFSSKKKIIIIPKTTLLIDAIFRENKKKKIK